MLKTIKYLIGSAGPSGYGSKSTAEQVTDGCVDLHSCTAIITGATSGIGAETARVLAKRGARVIIPARNLKVAEEMKNRIESEFCDAKITVMHLDLSSLRSVKRFVSEFVALSLPLNLLINNAGKFSYDYGISEDGIEMTFATNYLGHFLLTKLLLKKMITTAKTTGVQGRIVNVTSGIHTWFSGDLIRSLGQITRDKRETIGYMHQSAFVPIVECYVSYVQGLIQNYYRAEGLTGNNLFIPTGNYDATRAYAISKLANVLHTKELACRLQMMEANVTVNCVHPGIVRTRLTRDREGFVTDLVFFLTSKFLKTIPQAAATTCYVATHPKLRNMSGKYFADCNEASNSETGCNLKEAARLWSFSEIMVSTDFKPVFAPCMA